MKQITFFIFLMGFAMLSACTSTRPYYQKQFKNWAAQSLSKDTLPSYTTFLIGDAGEPSLTEKEPVLQLLENQLMQAQQPSNVVFLGDNIYQYGLPDSSDLAKRQIAERKLIEQLKILKDYTGRITFIPGNHDWAKSKAAGRKHVLEQEAFIENYLARPEKVFLPSQACPTPTEVLLQNDLVIIFIDTEWWLHKHHQPENYLDCEAKSKEDFLLQLNDLIKKHTNKKIIVAGHHPLYSNGVHGGHFPLIEHLFPFAPKGKYIPMPVLGSIYVGYRKFIGSRQDIPHESYQKLRKALMHLFEQHPNLMYVCGHEHTLQYLQKKDVHLIISGAGSKTSHIARKPKAAFAHSQKGFARIDFYKNGEVWVEYWIPTGKGQQGELIFKHQLFTHNTSTAANIPNPNPSTETLPPTFSTALGDYNASGFKKWLWGENYRKTWATPVDFLVFQLDKTLGGLEIIKRGGGQATNSLRLAAQDGREYVLRSVDKQGDKALGEALKGTFVADIVQDQTSAAYPYSALVVPHLAEVAGIYHSNPQYVYLPKDDRLGEYKESFGDAVYLFEERAEGKLWEDAAHFGFAKNIKTTSKVIKSLTEDNDVQINQQAVLKNRLFDMWLGDWDRHDDQWTWAEHKHKADKSTSYSPIPRDRDQVFFDSDGLIIALGTRKWGIPKFQGFKHQIRDVAGLNFNNRYFDRYFLTQPSLEDWLATADTLQQQLTDAHIQQALAQIPQEVAGFDIAQITEKLKQRRQDLRKYAEQYYRFLSKTVNVLGSDKHERFEIHHLSPQQTQIKVYKIKKESRKILKLLYERTFKSDETNEIRLYGLAGEDEFILLDNARSNIKIRIIGGEDTDLMADSTQSAGKGKKTDVYDQRQDTQLAPSPHWRNHLSKDSKVNEYQRNEFKYDYFGPLFFGGFNVDDGLFLGGGVKITKHGFRKAPFASRQQIKANYALATSSFNFIYKGEFIHLIGKLDLLIDAELRSPNYVQNFFGLGNETLNPRTERGINYNRVRYTQWYFEPQLRLASHNHKHQWNFGAYFQNVEIENNPDRFISNFEENGLDESILEKNRYFIGVQSSYLHDSRNHTLAPNKGIFFNIKLARIKGINESSTSDINYTHLSSSWAWYQQLSSRLVLANRIGAAFNWGEYEFYQANTLGANENLRGFRNYRFAGDHIFYNNTDLRLRLFGIKSFLFNGSFGLLAVHDIGRVWLSGENSDKWHQSFGGGFWVNPAEAFIVSATLSHSEESNLLFVKFGFLF